ncbi:MAG: hypothetical protein ACK2T3_00245 [Candidatus Promineifilaceae bacterium]
MAVYKNSDQFYDAAEMLFAKLLVENPAAAEPIERAKLLMLFQCSDPSAAFLINGRRHPAKVEFGKVRIRPEITAQMPTDTLHEILLGELALKDALSNNALKVRGSIWKLTALADLFRECQSVYPEILKQQGLYL